MGSELCCRGVFIVNNRRDLLQRTLTTATPTSSSVPANLGFSYIRIPPEIFPVNFLEGVKIYMENVLGSDFFRRPNLLGQRWYFARWWADRGSLFTLALAVVMLATLGAIIAACSLCTTTSRMRDALNPPLETTASRQPHDHSLCITDATVHDNMRVFPPL